jgi:hypothetical protein
VIPFKEFRSRLLALVASNSPLLDEDELCDDMVAEGIVCWGSRDNDRGMEAGMPWDARSWEPRVWFLRKWWFLCGGWDGEMWRMARFWHNVRGDDLDVAVATV